MHARNRPARRRLDVFLVLSVMAPLLAAAVLNWHAVKPARAAEAGGRPVIAIVGSTASANPDDTGRNLVIAVGFDFRNIGGLSARELRVRLAAGPGGQPEVFRMAEDFRLANTIHPSTGFSRSLRVQTPVRVRQDGQAIVATQPVDILVRLSYADDGGQLYEEDFYMSYVTGQTQASHAAMEVKEALEARVTEVFAEAAKQ